MPQTFSDLASSITNHSMKHVNKHKSHSKLRSNQNRPRSSTTSSSSSSLSPSLSSSSGSIDTATTTIETNHSHVMVEGQPPTLQQIELVRHVWDRVCELRQKDDGPSVSPAHAFGLLFYKALFEFDPVLKTKLGNVIQQAQVLAAIMSYLTRSPSLKGESGSLKDLKPRSTGSAQSASSVQDCYSPYKDQDEKITAHTYVDILEHQASLSKGATNPVVIPPQIHPRQHPSAAIDATPKKYSDDVCPFYQQEQEEKYQQQLLLQQKQQDQQERQRESLQKDHLFQRQQILALQHQEDNHWFAYKLRELGIQYVEEYDLGPENLDSFGPALNSALKLRLGDGFTPLMDRAWNQVANFTFYHMKTGLEAHVAYHRRARRLSSGSYCSIEAGETHGACTIQ
ncbi:hypothetical protein [Absidia glauca]|uniref:Globin family profile domain-containing protein n=1 Tax=Absidia glauca TaxID=4829 RepID=A0A168R589_ABSGL|nr:hypothetical protein [Absidia glauca]